MNDVVYRAGTVADVPDAAVLFVDALRDLCARNGIAPPPFTAGDMEPVYRHLERTGVFDVAERGGRIVAFASGFVRGDRFFLSMFWTHPSVQRRGVGRPLLAHVWAEAERRGARTYAVWSSIDFAAIGSYLRTGMRPLGPIFTFGGPPRSEPRANDLVLAPFDVALADRVDRDALGIERTIDHGYFVEEKQAAHVVWREGALVGYFYAHHGRVGPAAWLDARDGRVLLDTALAIACTQAPTVTISALGTCHAALDAALALGLTIQTTAHFLGTPPFPTLDRYVPSGPALF